MRNNGYSRENLHLLYSLFSVNYLYINVIYCSTDIQAIKTIDV